MLNRWWAGAGAAAAVVVLAACGSSGGSSSASSSSSPAASTASSAPASSASAAGIKTASSSKGTVLTNAQGDTLYWFALDTATKSNCTGSCAAYWPPVIGKPSAASGMSLPGKWGTISRSGQLQATYDGHPLYTYKGDTAPGQVNGNGLNASGGLWWAVTPSGAKLAAAAPSPAASSSSSGGGGY